MLNIVSIHFAMSFSNIRLCDSMNVERSYKLVGRGTLYRCNIIEGNYKIANHRILSWQYKKRGQKSLA